MFPYYHVSPFRNPGTSREEIAFWRPSAQDGNPSHESETAARIVATDRAKHYGRSFAVIRTERHGQRMIGWAQASGRWVSTE